MPVEVSCPGCGLKLKAPDDRIGKKAKCKKCGTSFRVPGPTPAGESLGDPRALSAVAAPGLPLDDEDVPMAAAAEPEPEPLPWPPPPPARPAPDVSSLPSADPFDFS